MLDLLIGTLLGQALGGLPVTDPLALELKAWSARLLKEAVPRWGGVVRSGMACHERGCAHPASGACAACKRPTCLGHACVSIAADVVCIGCVKKVVGQGGVSSSGPEPNRSHEESEVDLRRQHLKVLGLKPGASQEDVKAAFRELAKQHHPDKHRTPARKKKASERFARMTLAYHWLIDHMDGKAAA